MGTASNPNVLRGHSAWSGYDTTSRDALFCLYPVLNTMTVSNFNGTLYSDAYFQTSFSGFQLDNVMVDPVVAFSVGRTSPISSVGRISYDLVIVDTNAAWNNDEYIVPVTGVWMITVQACVNSGGNMAVGLFNDGSPTIYYYSTNNRGPDMISNTIFLTLEKDTSLYTILQNASLYSDIRYQTALLGFQYLSKFPNIIWSVATREVHTGPIEQVPFEIILINRIGGWNPVIHAYEVQMTGVYYIHMKAGIDMKYGTDMQLVVNGEIKTNIYRSEAPHNGKDMRSKAVILRLVENDRLYIQLPRGYRLHSGTTFSGFLIYA